MVDRSYYTARESHYDDDIGTDADRYRASAFQPDDYAELYPGERIHAPPRRRGGSMGRALGVVLALSTCGWGLYETEAWWRPTASTLLEAALAAVERARAGTSQTDTTARAASSSSGLEPLPSRQIAEAPAATAGVAMAAGPTAKPGAPASKAEPAAQPESDDARGSREQADEMQPAEPLPPPEIDPADPHQKRALAAGLHPQLSRVLLSRLTETDYANARVAIDKAVRETPDSDKLIWPRQRETKLALFQVHFVPGAAPDCRRYVVTVTRDGWSTTALPMERCGVKKMARGPT